MSTRPIPDSPGSLFFGTRLEKSPPQVFLSFTFQGVGSSPHSAVRYLNVLSSVHALEKMFIYEKLENNISESALM